MEREKVREWYIKEYPTDTLGQEIKSDITFYDLFNALDHYENIYNFIGVGDSIIRERVFDKLAKIMGVEYDEVYCQWLRAKA